MYGFVDQTVCFRRHEVFPANVSPEAFLFKMTKESDSFVMALYTKCQDTIAS